MKRVLLLLAFAIVGVTFAAAQSEGVSLGDAARAQRQKKSQASPNGKVYDNDNLPRSGSLSTTSGEYGGVTPPPADARSGSAAKGAAKDGKEKSAEEQAKAQEDDFKQKVGDAKKKISDLEKELDIMQREQRLRAAAFYGDAGLKARPENQAKYQADEKKYQDDLKAKQDDLAAAKQSLEDLRDQIRKAGLPSGIGE